MKMETNFLKRLELQGFKSFAQKTTLEFSHPIIAIVGPNGSGKSNIVDAFRWILGEREAKQLRGDRLESLIFAGTSKKPPAGLARVSFYFSNRNNLFKEGGSEITLTRKIDRSGFSQFFLNNSEVRLKDILLILARAKLGTRGLTIIGQGESDIFIKSGPQERKEMIEEILGLKEFCLKKNQAQHQLTNSQINLDKAKAALEELTPHLRFLKKQKKRWDKRQEIEEELKILENQFFAFHQFQIKKSLGEISVPLKKLDAEVSKKTAEIKHLETQLEEVKKTEGDQKSFEEIRSKINELLNRRSFLEKTLGKLEAQKEMEKFKASPEIKRNYPTPINFSTLEFSTTLKSLISDLKQILNWQDLEKIKNTLKQWLEKLEKIFIGEEITEFKENKPILQSQDNFIEQKYQKTVAALKALEEELKDRKIEEEKIISHQRSFSQKFRNLVEILEEKKNELQTLERERQKMVFEKEKLNLKLKELEHQFETLGRSQEEFSRLETPYEENKEMDWSTAEKHILKLRGELAAIGEINQDLIKEADESEARYEVLKRQISDLEKASQDLKTMIKDLERKITVEFQEAFHLINEKFNQYFQLMFGGGKAKLKMRSQKTELRVIEENNPAEKAAAGEITKTEAKEEADSTMGIEIELSLPKHKNFGLDVLSGGEKSLVSIAAIFALIAVSPPPFLVLDEIDAALDETNARRFADLIKDFSGKTQFILITHNRATMEVAGILYGVILDKDGGSKILSLKLKEAVTQK
ncbi:hypothetical protein COY65_00550 [Candidatus Jorgensenbacteria bacterium CG_4_10_14_0_8_um_filter_39_13]|uniref:AAA+ ATPase domain-containing protein n=2 Tax=Candidatus Joergenseniibacteriota TaxID=1752739 RepID=A0A2M7RI99_9BACT|nr:MAG: hypothetical protein COV54_00690 [Candidatus Jorgensenbacteria bacterium CG11_big_fil_rev_8_21_14_0_20_38_23]PIY96485.1 MAG: hypothetical protein COY65_00550 [Candidatus Jorgensenbacteria bacterium CG_4_10_14_0_8_um_filter_39_13]